MLSYSVRTDAISPVSVLSLTPARASAYTIAQSRNDIVDTAAAEGSFETFLALMEELGMLEDLRGYGRFTVFMPTDQAFAEIPEATLEVLRSDRELMANILAYHIVSGGNPLLSDDLSSGESLRTLERSSIEIRRRRGNLYINGARVIDADIEASNGVIHAIDQVLLPPSLGEAP